MNIAQNLCGSDCGLEQLTPKERQVLGHLAARKSSKRIARDLEVTENTVNKHIAAVRDKWGTQDRYETVRLFLKLTGRGVLEGDENHPPTFLPRDKRLFTDAEPYADLPRSTEFRLSDVLATSQFEFPDTVAPKGLEALDARFGKSWRIAAIPLLALLLGMVLLCGLAVAQGLSQLL